MSLIARPTRQEALAAAEALVAQFPLFDPGDPPRVRLAGRTRTASVPTTLWPRVTERPGWDVASGPVRSPYLVVPAIAMVGSYQEITEAILDYRRMGVTQFLFVGWPDLEEIERFGTQILPRIRARERS